MCEVIHKERNVVKLASTSGRKSKITGDGKIFIKFNKLKKEWMHKIRLLITSQLNFNSQRVFF